MKKLTVVNPTYFEQSDVAAFIYQVLKIPPKPELRSDGKVVFRFDQDVTCVLKRFYENESVPISDFCQKLKAVRSMIFAMKGERGYGKKG